MTIVTASPFDVLHGGAADGEPVPTRALVTFDPEGRYPDIEVEYDGERLLYIAYHFGVKRGWLSKHVHGVLWCWDPPDRPLRKQAMDTLWDRSRPPSLSSHA